MSTTSNWIKVGSVLKSKKGDSSYLKLNRGVTLAKDTVLQLFTPKGEKTPDYVLFDVLVAKDTLASNEINSVEKMAFDK